MKISFSTLGCPGYKWADITATAKDLGYDGIEVRGILNELYVPHSAEFDKDLKRTLSELRRLSLSVPCLTSGSVLGISSDKERIQAIEYIDTAARAGVPYVRVLGDRAPSPGKSVVDEQVAAELRSLGEYAANKGVTCLIETNGVFSDSLRLLSLLSNMSRGVGVLWDVHHPFCYMGEPPALTYSILKDHIRHVHIKDSVSVGGKIRYKMLGEGSVPLKEALSLLKNGGYGGFVSLEWVKRWYNDLEEPGIVFSQAINYIRRVLGED